MAAQVLHFPTSDRPEIGGGPRAVAKMHYRFEIRWLADEIVGRMPRVRILQIAWHEKRRHVAGYIRDYHDRHKALPSGWHDLGVTDELRLTVGPVDFDHARQRLYRSLEPRSRFAVALAGMSSRFNPGRLVKRLVYRLRYRK